MPGILRTRRGEGSGDREAGPRPWRTHIQRTRRGRRKVLNREAYGPISISEALFWHFCGGPGVACVREISWKVGTETEMEEQTWESRGKPGRKG